MGPMVVQTERFGIMERGAAGTLLAAAGSAVANAGKIAPAPPFVRPASASVGLLGVVCGLVLRALSRRRR